MLYQLSVIDFQINQNAVSDRNPLKTAQINIQKAIDLNNYLKENKLTEKICFLSNRIKFKAGNFEDKNWKELRSLSEKLEEIEQDSQQIQRNEIQFIFEDFLKFKKYDFSNPGF